MSASPVSQASPGKRQPSWWSTAVEFWWVKFPGRLRRYSFLLWAAWSDGIYLTAWPRIATILVAAVLLLGFIEGGTHWSVVSLDGYGLSTSVHAVSFAQMLPLLILAVVLGSVSANLGLLLVVGFALGDFFWAGVPFSPWERNLTLPPTLYGRVPQIAAYLVFFFLAAWPIIATKCLAANALARFRESELWKTVLMAIVQALFIYEWTYFAPMGVKQQWDCCMQTSPLDVRYFHQTTVPWLLAAAVIGIVVRRLLIIVAEKRDPEGISRLHAVLDPPWTADPRMPGWLHAIIGATIMSLLISGFTASVGWAAAMFAALASILLARIYALPRLAAWRAWSVRIVRYPAALRLIAATAATYLICSLLQLAPGRAASAGHTTGNFGPELAAILIGFVMLLVLLPNGVLAPQEAELASDGHPPRPPPSAAVQAVIIIGFVLLSAKKAFADACQDTRCCFRGENGLASSSTAATTPSASSTAPKAVRGTPDPCEKERQAVQRAEDALSAIQAELDASGSQLARLQEQVAQQIVQLQTQGLSAEAESIPNPALSAAVANLQAQLQSFGDPAALLTPGTIPSDFFSSSSLSNANAILGQASGAIALAQAGPFPLTTAFLNSLLQLAGQFAMANGLLNSFRNLQGELQNAQADLKSNEELLAECEAKHGGDSQGG